MPIRRPRRAPRRPIGVRKRRVPPRRNLRKKAFNPLRQSARILETIELTDMRADEAYSFNFSLSQFFRATTLAKNFRFYKAAKVKWEYMPFYNTFQEGNSTGTVSKPQMYFVMNREQNPYWQSRTAATSLFAIQSQGADPVPFTNNREIIYTPNWCSPGLTALTFSPVVGASGTSVDAVTNVISCGLKKQFGWVPCPDLDLYNKPKVYDPTDGAADSSGNTLNMSPNATAAVLYNGHDLYVQQEREPNTPVCKVVCTVEWIFKGAKNNYVNEI